MKFTLTLFREFNNVHYQKMMEKKFKKRVSGGGQDKERETTRAFDNKFIDNCLNRIRLVLVFWLGLVSLCHLGCLV